jgi:hypothetical protein
LQPTVTARRRVRDLEFLSFKLGDKVISLY